jgi:hypothetical protein
LILGECGFHLRSLFFVCVFQEAYLFRIHDSAERELREARAAELRQQMQRNAELQGPMTTEQENDLKLFGNCTPNRKNGRDDVMKLPGGIHELKSRKERIKGVHGIIRSGG